MTALAIVGAGCVLPDADGPQALWENLVAGRDCVTPATEADWGVDPRGFFDPRRGTPDRTCNVHGGWIREDADADAEAGAALGTLVSWPLRAARDALRASGLPEHDARLTRCGLVLGCYPWAVSRGSQRIVRPLYERLLVDQPARLLAHAAAPPDVTAALLAGDVAPLLARSLGLGGPRYSIDAACATLLYAIELARLHLASGAADVMVAAAVSASDPLFATIGFAALQALPVQAPSRPLDAASDGLSPAQGACAFVLKRERDALRDGDQPLGIVRAVGLSSDGRGQHLLAPSRRGQSLAYRRAYEKAGLEPAAIDCVECHATGTRAGDRTELEGLAELFASGAMPLLGTVKANIGHALTAAGGAGLLKLLLGLEHGLIAPTVGVETPLDVGSCASRIARVAHPWAKRAGHVRRGAVNSFGFGGTNAHLVLEEAGRPTGRAEVPVRAGPLAIIGMDACFGSCGDLAALAGELYDGCGGAMRALPPGRWRGLERHAGVMGDHEVPHGAFVEAIDYDALRYRMPPAELERLDPQHLLALQVGDRAIVDAGLAAGGRVAVLVAMGAPLRVHRLQTRWELAGGEAGSPSAALAERLHAAPTSADFAGYIGNLMASRIAELWDFSGPAFALAAGNASSLRCLDVARLLLAAGEADAVVVAAVDLAGDPESVLLRQDHDPLGGAPARAGFDVRAHGWQIGEGAAAVVLKALPAARADGDRIYAALRSLHVAEGGGERADGARIAGACREAMRQAGVAPGEVGYLEAHASGVAVEDEAEVAALADIFGDPSQGRRSCAVASAKAHVGHAFAAAGLASVVRAALCLHERYLPAVPRWAGAAAPPAWAATGLWVGEQPQPWFAPAGRRRIAAVNALGEDGSCGHALLEDEPAAVAPLLARVGSRPACVVALIGATVDELLALLDAAERDVQRGATLTAVSASTLARAAELPRAPLALCLVAADGAELAREARLARDAIGGLHDDEVWQTPAGSIFVATPVGATGEVAFVFPGMTSAYPGLGRELLQCFPRAHAMAARVGADATLARWDELVFARRLAPSTAADREAFEERLLASPSAGLQIPALFGAIATWLLRDGLGLAPSCALGYSLGELSMLLALGGWRPGASWLERFAETEPLRSQLSGPMTAVRAVWQLGVEDDLAWSSYVVLAPAGEVGALVGDRADVYLSHVCAPAECIVSGRESSCREVIDESGLEALRAPSQIVVHCPPTRSVEGQLTALLTAPIELAAATPCRLYVGAGDAGAQHEPRALAAALAASFGERADFPAGVERAYADGARIFVEVGPGASCTRWVSEVLRGRPHAALALDHRGVDDATGVARLLAALVAQRVALDLRPWIASLRVPAAPRLARRTSLGGSSLLEEEGDGETATRTSPVVAEPVAAAVRAVATFEPAPVAARVTAEHTTVAVRANGATTAPAAPTLALAAVASTTRATTAHVAWLDAIDRTLRRGAQLALGSRASAATTPPRVLFDEADMLEFAEGRVARVLGDELAAADGFARRVRLPGPPFLAVSRVTSLDAPRGRLGPGRITTEFDVPHSAWYAVDGQVPSLAVDAQGLLFLLAYMGADLENRGRRVFRWLDGTITYARGLPRAGQTITYDIAIDSFARDGDSILFFSHFSSSVDGEPLGRIDDCCAGFFTDAELARGEGIGPAARPGDGTAVRSGSGARSAARPDRTTAPPRTWWRAPSPSARRRLRRSPPATSPSASARTRPASLAATRHCGCRRGREDDRPCSRARSERWARGARPCRGREGPRPGRLVPALPFQGRSGPRRPFMLEASFQILQLVALVSGIGAATRDARFQPLAGRSMNVRFRGQILAGSAIVTYRAEVVETGMAPEPYVIADVDVLSLRRTVGRLSGVGIRLEQPDARR